MNIPANISLVTADWLSQQLGRPVESFTATKLGNGFMSDVYRLSLVAPSGHTSSIVLKLAADSADRRQVASEFDSYGKEVLFYESFSQSVNIQTPTCYFSQIDDVNNLAIALEDLTHIPSNTNQRGATFDETLLAMETLARLHAHRWQGTPASLHKFTTGFEPAADYLACQNIENLFHDNEVTALVSRYMADSMQYLPHFLGQPQVLSHMDFRLDNLKFDGKNLIVLDWGELSLAPPGFDLATFLATSITAENRLDWEETALSHYLTTLDKLGIPRQSQAALSQCYRLCLLPMIYLPLLVRDSGTNDELHEILCHRLESALASHLTELNSLQ